MKPKNELPDFLDEIIRKSGVRRLRGMEMFHVHLLAECLKQHGMECKALHRTCPSQFDQWDIMHFYVLEIDGSVFDLRGAKGWDNLARARQLRKGARGAASFVPKWEKPPVEYDRGAMWGQGEPQLRRAVDEVMSAQVAKNLSLQTPDVSPRQGSRPRM